MPRSTISYRSLASDNEVDDDDEVGEQEAEATRNAYINAVHGHTAPVSPVQTRTSRLSDADIRGRLSYRPVDESTGLLSSGPNTPGNYMTIPASAPGTPLYGLRRNLSYAGSLHGVRSRHHSRRGSFGLRLARALGTEPNQTEPNTPYTAKSLMALDDRVWYDQFTSTDWVHDSIADAYRLKELRSRKDLRGRLYAFFDGAQGWVLVAIIGVITAWFAYFINITEATIFDYKEGHCTTAWWLNRRKCCGGASTCPEWCKWSDIVHSQDTDSELVDFLAFLLWVIVLSAASCLITLQTRTVISSAVSLSTLDENLGADRHHSRPDGDDKKGSITPKQHFEEAAKRPPVVYYPAAGSGVAEVKVILSGFVLHGYLGLTTLVCKTLGLILSVASGLSLGKEGPYVHIATCVGNIASRAFRKYRQNDGKRREVLSASAAAGVAVAFGAPIGGVLFSLEEVSYYFPPKTLFRTFFCCIAAALSLRFLDPYGTGKIVLFEVRYIIDWKLFELIAFILLGVLGGLLGALFIKASRLWAKTFRRITMIKQYPIFEVFLVAVATGLVGFWNRYTKLPVAELLFELAAPCDAFTDTGIGLCPTEDRIPTVMWYLTIAFIIKALLTTVTFGIKVPAGIYVPSMVVGGLMGRIVGHLVQWLTLTYPNSVLFASCPVDDGNPESCVVPGVYALVAAGATMCGVTRLSVTLAVILFELTGSLEHVLPFALGVLIAKWTADAFEPLSIYDLLTDMNAYPYLDSKVRPVFTANLGDITAKPTRNRFIDVSTSPLVPARSLRSKLDHLHMAGELDGGLPVIRDGVLVGLIAGPDLEFALDRLEGEESALCLMSPHDRWQGPGRGVIPSGDEDDDSMTERDVNAEEAQPATADAAAVDLTDFTPFIDPAPVALDIGSPMDLVFECFVKLGLRFICVLKEGRFAGMVHKKAFVKYVKQVEKEEGR
jgi:chloride channel 3/4/5